MSSKAKAKQAALIAERVAKKQELIDALSSAVKDLQLEFYRCGQSKIDQPTTPVLQLCAHLDWILRDGVVKSQQEHGFYRYAKLFSRKDVIKQIDALKNVKTDIGRGRAWIRIALNESSMEAYIRMFLDDVKHKKKFYASDAVLYNEEQGSLVTMLLSGLDFLTFEIEYDVKLMDPMKKNRGGQVQFDRPDIPAKLALDPSTPSSGSVSSVETHVQVKPKLSPVVVRRAQKDLPMSGDAVDIAALVSTSAAGDDLLHTHTSTKKKKKKKKVRSSEEKAKRAEKKREEVEKATVEATTSSSVIDEVEPTNSNMAPNEIQTPPKHAYPTAATNSFESLIDDKGSDVVLKDSDVQNPSPPPTSTSSTITDSVSTSPITMWYATEGEEPTEPIQEPIQIDELMKTMDTIDNVVDTTTHIPTESVVDNATQDVIQNTNVGDVEVETELTTSLERVHMTTTTTKATTPSPPRTKSPDPVEDLSATFVLPSEAALKEDLGMRPRTTTTLPPPLPPTTTTTAHTTTTTTSSESVDAVSEEPEETLVEEDQLFEAEQLIGGLGADIDLEKDTNTLLMIKLQIFQEDDEELVKLVRLAMLRETFERSVHVLITNRNFYILTPSAKSDAQSYAGNVSIPFYQIRELKHTHGGNGLRLLLQSSSGPGSCQLLTGDISISNAVYEALVGAMMAQNLPRLPPADVEAQRWAQSIVQFAGAQEGRMDPATVSCWFGYRKVNAKLFENELVHTEMLELKESGIFSQSWKPQYFALQGARFMQFESNTARNCKLLMRIDDPNFWCKKVVDAEGKHCLEVGNQQATIIVACPTFDGAEIWFQSLQRKVVPCVLGNVDHFPSSRVGYWVPALIILTAANFYVCHGRRLLSKGKLERVGSFSIETVTAISAPDDVHGCCRIEFDEDQIDHTSPYDLLFKSRYAMQAFTNAIRKEWKNLYQVALQTNGL